MKKNKLTGLEKIIKSEIENVILERKAIAVALFSGGMRTQLRALIKKGFPDLKVTDNLIDQMRNAFGRSQAVKRLNKGLTDKFKYLGQPMFGPVVKMAITKGPQVVNKSTLRGGLGVLPKPPKGPSPEEINIFVDGVVAYRTSVYTAIAKKT